MRMATERIVIRPVEERDLLIALPWWNDAEVMLYADDDPSPHKTLEELRQQFDKEKGEWAPFMERFIIETIDARAIGTVMYRNYRPDTRSAYMGIFLGKKAYWGQGYGTEAIRLFLKHLFEHKGLHKVAVTVSDFNVRATRAYAKCGFRQDGVLRDNAVVSGRYVSHMVMSLLENEYLQLRDELGSNRMNSDVCPTDIEFSSTTAVDMAQATEIVRLRTAAWGGDPDERVVAEEAEALRQEVMGSDPGAYGLFVARTQGALAGFVKAQQDAENPSVWWWLGLMVHPGYRRCGIARGLLERSAAYAREHGATILRSDTHLDNAASIAMHERLGFRNDGVFESPYDGDKKVAFTLVLARDHESAGKVT